MIVICAYCKMKLGEKEPLDNKDTTHGICNKCREKEEQKYIELQVTELIEKILGDEVERSFTCKILAQIIVKTIRENGYSFNKGEII